MTWFCHVDFKYDFMLHDSERHSEMRTAWLNSEHFGELFPHLVVLQLGQTLCSKLMHAQKRSKALKASKNNNTKLDQLIYTISEVPFNFACHMLSANITTARIISSQQLL